MSVSPNKSQLWIRVLYDYKYATREGQEVTITKDEKLVLLDKTNSDWWHAQRLPDNEPFFVPATYVEELPENNDCKETKNNITTQKSSSTEQDASFQSNESETHESPSKEEKKNHDSFRNVIRKLSGNLNSSSAKPVKMVKVTKKNSMNSHDEKCPKPSPDSKLSEASAFAKCFGRDMKHSDSRPQNRFQEELENALVNRCQRNIVYSSKLDDHPEPKSSQNHAEKQPYPKPFAPPDKAASQQKLEKLTQKLQDNKSKSIDTLTKEFESRVQRQPKSTKSPTPVQEPTPVQPSEAPSSSPQAAPKRPAMKRGKLKIELPKPEERRPEVAPEERREKRASPVAPPARRACEMDDAAILRDARKMWAIERLMSELLQSSGVAPPSPAKSIFDFSVSPSAVAPKSVAKKSPKVLDEYNEANILNDNEQGGAAARRYEKPAYSSVPVKSPRQKCPAKGADGAALQLTPSLEKLASEIRFIPANRATEMSRQCSKSDTALNELHRPKPRQNAFGSLDKGYESAKKAAKPRRTRIFNRKLSFATKDSVKETRSEQLRRKAKSLDDLNLAEEEVGGAEQGEGAKEGGKPGAMCQSTDSLKRSGAKPVPAKRRIFDGVSERPGLSGSCENVRRWPIDLERSTAVGFKTLLRTSDSGSEEFLQNKTFPNADEGGEFASNDNLFQESDTVNLSESSRNVSSEMMLSSMDSLDSNTNASFEASGADNFVQLPEGWKQEIDLKTRQVCYVNEMGDKWFSSNDAEGKIYFFEENSNKSSWALPVVKDRTTPDTKLSSRHNSMDNFKVLELKPNRKVDEMNELKHSNWPQLFHGNMCILKEGFLNRTKITEQGKKLKKCWGTSYAVLTELFLLFFRDEKIFSAMKMGHLSTAKPDISVDLNGASIESGEKFSSRKNVFLISTIFGLQVLIQSDNLVQSTEWYQEIQDAVKALPSGQEHGKGIYTEE